MERLWRALWNSVAGIQVAWREEKAFQQELILALVMVPLAFYLAPSPLACAVMIASVMLVLVAELLNTGIEAAIDYISEERHPLAKKAKDTASAAVFLSLVNLAIVWALVLVGGV